ncbi:MAG: universal stress protein [Brevefilum sp.]|nr:universal stress protein [Brevefilum sp.]MDT8381044.1 universal stress protein [Brevefilum sp.]MDW7754668.1 universal stress protein [Brevefilum sp.]
MTDDIQPICVERILVSLDSSSHSFSALKAAVELAHHYNASLKGVFIHDSKLLNLANMPFLREVGEYTAITREISSDGITRGMVVQSRWITQTFHKLTNQTGLHGEFEILHGNIDQIIDQEAENCDLLVIGKSGTNPFRKRRLGSTAKMVIKEGKKPLLLVEENNQLGHPIFVMFDNSPVGWVSLEAGRDLLNIGENLNILINEDSAEEYRSVQKKIRSWAVEKQINIAFQAYKTESFDRFLDKIFDLKIGLFIMPRIIEDMKQSLIEKCLRRISLPILLIQQQACD